MREDEEIGLMLLALAMMVGGRKVDVQWGSGWVWPVPTLRIGGVNYDAVASHEFDAANHHGLDIMYRRKSAADLVQIYQPGSHDGNARFFAPPRTPIVAAKDGRIWDVVQWENGWAIRIDHGKPFATAYLHIETPAVPLHRNGRSVSTGLETRVRAGDVIGFMGYDPSQRDPSHLRHLHFEVHYNGSWANAVDAENEMRAWPRPSLVFKP